MMASIPYVVCLATCVMVDIFYFPHAITFPDEHRLLASAIRLATTGEFWIANDRAWEMPGTALFFAPAVMLFGSAKAVLAIRLVQALLVLIQCFLVGSIAKAVFRNHVTAVIATAIFAVYPFIIYYQGLLLTETLFDTLFLGAVAALYRWRDRGMAIDANLVTATLLFALATLTKASLTVLPPLLIAATGFVNGVRFRRLLAIFATSACLYAAFVSPWWIRNAFLFHSFVPFATNGAQNLYLGNNSANHDGGADWATDADPQEVTRFNAIPDEITREHAYSRAAIRYIEANPGGAFVLALKKFVRFWNVIPNTPQFRGVYAVISAISFTPVLVLALAAVARQRHRWPAIAPLLLIVGYFTCIYAITVASIRYRLPLEPLLIVLAAEPVAAIVTAARANKPQATS